MSDGGLFPSLIIPVRRSYLVVNSAGLVVDDDRGSLRSARDGIGPWPGCDVSQFDRIWDWAGWPEGCRLHTSYVRDDGSVTGAGTAAAVTAEGGMGVGDFVRHSGVGKGWGFKRCVEHSD